MSIIIGTIMYTQTKGGAWRKMKELEGTRPWLGSCSPLRCWFCESALEAGDRGCCQARRTQAMPLQVLAKASNFTGPLFGTCEHLSADVTWLPCS